jgi:hypothetical protein
MRIAKTLESLQSSAVGLTRYQDSLLSLGNAKVYNGTNATRIDGWTQLTQYQPYTLFCSFYDLDGWPPSFSDSTEDDSYDYGTPIVAFGNEWYWSPRAATGAGQYMAYVNSTPFKSGYNIGILTYDGSNSSLGVKIYVNGVLSGRDTTSAAQFPVNGPVNQSIVNGNNQLWINSYYGRPLFYHFSLIKKVQIISRTITSQEAATGYLNGGLDGLISDNDFLLDIDFNRQNNQALQSRYGTPQYTYTELYNNLNQFQSYL